MLSRSGTKALLEALLDLLFVWSGAFAAYNGFIGSGYDRLRYDSDYFSSALFLSGYLSNFFLQHA